mgnify:CR=1 FL=1
MGIRDLPNLHRRLRVPYLVLPKSDFFLSRISTYADENGCWWWRDRIDQDGYGICTVPGTADHKPRRLRAHRVSYQLFVGLIEPDMVLDHLCRNRRCVNPAHLEPITRKENTLRGNGPTAINHRKTLCVHGHDDWATKSAGRYCRECDRLKDRNKR